MNKDFWERIDKLEKLAGKVTQGEWSVNNLSEIVSIEGGNTLCLAYSGFDSDGNKWDGKINASYIAAVNPAMIKEMIAESRRLKKEANWLAEKLEANIPLLHEDDGWRETARKAVEEEKE